MTILKVGIAIPDLGIVRAHPCGILVSSSLECGATPASLYRRECGVAGHSREIWVCPVHAMYVGAGMAICRECAGRRGIRAVRLIRLTEPVRIPS